MRTLSNWTPACIAGGLLALTGLMVTAGPLNPPAGPVASTYKTLSEVEPRIPIQSLTGDAGAQYVISQPGSYYLTGNINGVVGKHGIAVRASNVVIDLCGFTMNGQHFVQFAIDGHSVAAGLYSGLTVKNGVIYDWNNEGIFADHIDNCRFEALQLRNTLEFGAFGGQGTVIRDCVASNCRRAFSTGNNSVVEGCVAEVISEMGIAVGINSSISRCSVSGASPSFFAISCGDGSTVSNCSVGGGITAYAAGENCTLQNCSATAGGSTTITTGFSAGAGTRLTQCVARNIVQIAFSLGDGAAAVQCSSFNAGATGIVATGNASILDCDVRGGLLGIDVGGACRVERCKVGNAATAIRAGTANTISGNTLNAPAIVTGTGIQITNQDNRIDHNHVYTFSTGVDLGGSFNVVTANEFHFVNVAVGGAAVPGCLVSPVVGTAASLTADHSANIVQ